MSAHTKVSGTWKGILAMFVNVSGVWKRASLYTKASGVWKLVQATIPNGLIVLFRDTPPYSAGWKLCDGTNGTPNLLNRFLSPASTIGQTGGGANGHSHGTENVSWTLQTTSGASGRYHNQHYLGGQWNTSNIGLAHSHYVTASHSHGDSTGSCDPSYLTLIPAMADGANSIPSGAIFLKDNTDIPSGFSRVDVTDKYILMDDVGNVSGGGQPHYHGEVTSTSSNNGSSVSGYPGPVNIPPGPTAYGDAHSHSFLHDHTTGALTPPYRNYLAISAASEQTELPAGVIGIYYSTAAPDGWSFVGTESDIRLIRLGTISSVGVGGGSANHTHSHPSGLTSQYYGSAYTWGFCEISPPNCCTSSSHECISYQTNCCADHFIGYPTPTSFPAPGWGGTILGNPHSHQATVTSDSVPAATSIPSYITIRLVKKQ